MSWLPALVGWWPWVVLGMVPIGIIAMYFLKLRREVVEVPSTYLWSRTIEDLHVNSLLQRLRNSVLLFLQLLAVTLVAMALLRPGVATDVSSLGRIVFLLDSSASMQALVSRDRPERSRFEEAKSQVLARIDSMTDQESAMLVTFSDRAEVMQAFTSDRNRLRDALSRCQVTNRPTDVLGALNAADGLANPKRTSEEGSVDVQVADAQPAELVLLSDGNFQDVTEFNLGNLQPTYRAIGSDRARNLAIVNFSAERDVQDSSQVDVFATVLNAGTQSAASDVSLMLDDELIDAAAVDLEPEDQTGLSFKITAENAVRLELRLEATDDLALDNTAYAALTPAGLAGVLVVTPGNQPLEIGLSTEKLQSIASVEVVSPDYLKSEAYSKRAIAGSDDLVIYDRCVPSTMPSTNTFFIGTLPPPESSVQDEASTWRWAGDRSSLTLIDLNRTHPVMRYLELYSLLIFSGRAITPPTGSVVLAEADIGPVLAIGSRRGYQDLVLGFELVSEDSGGEVQANTNWYAERSWPVFLLNVLRQLAGAASSSGAPSHPPGETVLVRVDNAVDAVDLTRRDSSAAPSDVVRLPVGTGGIVEVTQTDPPGNYQLMSTVGDRLVDQFVVNLFDIRESTLATRRDVELGYETVAAADAGMSIRREYWRWLLMLVLAVLAVEWWVYGRRVA
ncbi:MAG: VWA domain-containing protein [Planctomycetota bacterium]